MNIHPVLRSTRYIFWGYVHANWYFNINSINIKKRKLLHMKKIKILILVVLINSYNQKIKSQDSLSFHKEFYKTQQNSLLLLSSWSVGNLALSPFLGK